MFGLWGRALGLRARGAKCLGKRHMSSELLEARLPLTASIAYLSDGLLEIVGTDLPDDIQVDMRDTVIVVTLADQTGVGESSFGRHLVASMRFHGYGGDDQFRNNTNVPATAFGGDDDDLLIGGSQADVFYGGLGNDHLIGNGGEDELRGEDGHDQLDGGDGDDLLRGETGVDLLVGGNGTDTLVGSEGNDQLDGGAGHDFLWGGDGDDLLEGGDGDDELRGEDGNDRIYGGLGNDTGLGGLGNDLIIGGPGIDTLYGTEGDDELVGNGGTDTLVGGPGHDRLLGGDDDDDINGNEGDDQIDGGAGSDLLVGGAGHDAIVGGVGDDVVWGGIGNDTIDSGDGDDTIRGEEGDDQIDAGPGADWATGGDGDDVVAGGPGDDSLFGGAGFDRLDGDAGRDELFGEDDNDQLFGGDDDDTIHGGPGDDYLRGGDGDDTINGAEGDDQVFGEVGNDIVNGSFGNDIVTGGDGNDIVHGEAGDDILMGNDGDDQLFGHDGSDILLSGTGNDISLSGNGNDALLGNDGDDQLDGGDGDDVVLGGSGIDRVVGGYGNDIVFGGQTRLEEYRTWGDLRGVQHVLATWTSNLSHEDRIATLSDSTELAYLTIGGSLFDDGATDIVTGGPGRDWHFFIGGTSVPHNAHHDTTTHSGAHAPSIESLDDLPVDERAFLLTLDDIDLEKDETLTTNVPHPTTPSERAAHFAMLDLVPYGAVSHVATHDGNWSDPASWLDGRVPGNGANVLVPSGVMLTVDGTFTDSMHTLRVDGHLRFATDRNTQLRLDTFYVNGTGYLEMGRVGRPIDEAVMARISITDSGPIDRAWDPRGVSRGLIVHGRMTAFGAAKSEFTALAQPVAAGARQIALTVAPVNWRVGDTIAIAGVSPDRNETEVRVIEAISDRVITVAPLNYSHQAPSNDLEIHVANLSRNVVIESEVTTTDRRGHVMFMHSQNADLRYVGFNQLGRTDKSVILNDSQLDTAGNLVPGTGSNPRARYPVHFHRGGISPDSTPALILGSVVVESPGWGFVNHSSHVDFVRNISFDVFGAGFAAEAGDEIGTMTANLAMVGRGSGEHITARHSSMDFGHQGDGFWFQGTGVAVVDNVAVGMAGQGFAYYPRGLIEGVLGQREFLAANLNNVAAADNAETVRIEFASLKRFAGNVTYGSQVGLTTRYLHVDGVSDQWSTVEDFTAWNVNAGVEAAYTRRTIFDRIRLIGNDRQDQRYGFHAGLGSTGDIVLRDLEITGFYTGMVAPLSGHSELVSGYLRNQLNIRFDTIDTLTVATSVVLDSV